MAMKMIALTLRPTTNEMDVKINRDVVTAQVQVILESDITLGHYFDFIRLVDILHEFSLLPVGLSTLGVHDTSDICLNTVYLLRNKQDSKRNKTWSLDGCEIVFELSTRGTVHLDNWYLGLPEQAMACSYHPLDYGWTPLSQDPC
ncbi:MAG: hypothetical protein JOS17DRAFT_771119 [Linnemannia elongata]|nr:MAG: hypothetical protein JOS17DRAFT_771119 [Linnemannia elongata]